MSTLLTGAILSRQLSESLGTTDLEACLRPLQDLLRNRSLLESMAPAARLQLESTIQNLAGLSSLCAQVEQTYAENETQLRAAMRHAELSGQELESANVNMNTIINCLGQGFVLINLEGYCLPFYSTACEDLLETAPAGKHLRDLLRVLPEQRNQFDSWLRLLLEEAIDFDDLSALAPGCFAHSRGKHVTLEFRPVRSAEGALRSVLLIATDRTEEATAKQAVVEKERYVDRIIKMAKHRNDFFQFLEYMWKAAESIHKPPLASSRAERFDEIRRLLHTIKGGANTFIMDELASDIHIAESQLGEPLDDYSRFEQLILRHLTSIQREFAFLIGDPRHLGQTRVIYRNQIEKFLRQIETLPGSTRVREVFMRTTLAVPVMTLVQHYTGMIMDLAEKLNKKVLPLEITSQKDLFILPEPYQEVFTNLIHVFTNMVDHGIEAPDLRLQNGKPEAGHIRIHFRETSSETASGPRTHLIVEIEDDGGGIDPQKIREASKNNLTLAERLSDEDVIQLIFESGISSRKTVTQHSGRGIGMNALLRAVTNLNGSIVVQSEVGQFARFVIELPLLWSMPETKTPAHVKPAAAS